jgi:hypothetical protein
MTVTRTTFHQAYGLAMLASTNSAMLIRVIRAAVLACTMSSGAAPLPGLASR